MHFKRSSLLVAGAFALASVFATSASAQYPDRPIRIIVPQAAGSATDNIGRIVAAELTKELGQPIVIENRPGGAFVIGNDAVAKSAPDGYTLGIGNIGGMAIAPNMTAKLPYDLDKDFQPIAQVTQGHLMLIASPKSGIKSIEDLIARAKANPGKLTNASSATGSPGHVGAEMFKHMTGTDIVHVPYKGGAPAIADLIAGRVDIMFESLASSSVHVQSGAVIGLGVSGDARSKAFPNIPTIGEVVKGYSAPTWSGVIAPAGVPKEIVERLNVAVNKALRSEAFIERFAKIGDEPAGGTSEEFAAFIKKERAKWKEVVDRAGIKLN
jgi:tripartite-type tricarboxylate transporter receptor subunit TctC